MKAKYIKPTMSVIVLDELCTTNGLELASVHSPSGRRVDQFPVVEEDESKDQYDWSSKSYGGD